MKTDLTVCGYIFDKDKVLLIHHNKLNLWLPVGGHIDENETPDQALLREIEEEVGLNVEILNQTLLPDGGNMKKHLAIPFYVNLHSVGDHDHVGFYYICKALNPEKLKIASKELKNFQWIGKGELDKEYISLDVKNQCLKAFELIEQLSN